ncbi:MAG: PqqD family protein [Vicinamibacterales bacterium]
MTATLNHRVDVRPDIVFRALGTEAIILNLESGVYFGLDEVGTQVWTLLLERDLGSTVAALAAMYDAPAEQIEADVLALVDQLVAKGLVTLVPAAASR